MMGNAEYSAILELFHNANDAFKALSWEIKDRFYARLYYKARL